MYMFLLLRSFCHLNKIKIRFFVIAFTRLHRTRFFITLFIPHFLNKTTSVAENRGVITENRGVLTTCPNLTFVS